LIEPLRLKELTPERKRAIIERIHETLERIKPKVSEILRDVKSEGDSALLKYTLLFDGVRLKPSELRVSEKEFEEARRKVPEETSRALKEAMDVLEKFHRAQLPREGDFMEIQPGVWLKDSWMPIESVGVYIPGGRASYPSTVLMTVVPARVAGVRKIIACTPPRLKDGKVTMDPTVLFALELAGVRELYRLGGAQAIAAMAYGTETIPKVQKIIGPGNVYVTAAKLLLAGIVGIDCLAGPSEILILADGCADPEIVLADLLSQLEHGSGSSALLVTTSKELAYKLCTALKDRAQEAPFGEDPDGDIRFPEGLSVLIAEDEEEALEFVNEYAPEHLEILTRAPMETLKGVKNAGSVFLGPFSPVAVGDYATGANHILPTAGSAKFQSGLSVFDFLRRFTVQRLSPEGLERLRKTVGALARAEGLPLHAEAVEARFRDRRQKMREKGLDRDPKPLCPEDQIEALADMLNYRHNGLIVAIAQDCGNDEVLMVAFMDKEAFKRTLATGLAHYWSTSRGRLWLKGEESGHVQVVREVYLDCDADAILLKVEQKVAACHKGYRSCFYRRLEGGEFKEFRPKIFEEGFVYKSHGKERNS
jgi:histidinol dehydrogenase